MPKQPRCLDKFALAILCLTGLGAIAGTARAQSAEPGQVIGYANADRSGPSQAWDLPPDKPYLYVAAIPAALNGRVMAIETGPEVGVALFKNPYFTSRDQGCQPTLGTAQAPRRPWLGATARFVPTVPGQPGAPPPESADTGYGSLIVYRADLGPPPGALFLSRRVTLGLRCANPVHKTVYNRIFVPVAEAPDAVRCFDLVGDYPGPDKQFQLDFVKSDRLVLMMPDDLSERYARIRHDYTVTLYDGLSCTGTSITLDSRARAGRDVRLAQRDFRDRSRSLRLSYDYGNADAFLVRQQTPPAPAPVTAAREPKPDTSTRTQALAAQPIEDPAVDQTPPVSAPIPAPQPAPAPESPAKAPAVPTQIPQAATRAAPVSPSTAPVQSTKAPSAVPKPDTAASASSGLAATRSAVAAPVKSPGAIAAGKPVTAPTATRQSTAPVPTARTIPKLSPRLTPPGPQTTALPSLPKTFAYPVHDLYRLNHCLYWQRDCGEPAASAWCRARGFSKALKWTIDKDIGAIFPTVILGDQEVCARAGCDGFKKITCTP